MHSIYKYMKFPLIFGCIFLCSGYAYAQVTITEIQTLNFGTILANPGGDTITVKTNNGIREINGSDLQGGHSPAIFRFEGPGRTSISYSFSTNDTLRAKGERVDLRNFVANRSSPFSLPGSGVRDLVVGADIIIPPNLNGGSFSGNYMLIIDYP